MGHMLYSKWIDVFKMLQVLHMAVNYFQSYLFQFTNVIK